MELRKLDMRDWQDFYESPLRKAAERHIIMADVDAEIGNLSAKLIELAGRANESHNYISNNYDPSMDPIIISGPALTKLALEKYCPAGLPVGKKYVALFLYPDKKPLMGAY